MKKILFAVLFAASSAAHANVTYIGSFNVNDGPHWTSNPTVYSAREAAALIFGGVYTDYSISTDPNSITHTAWYDGWGDHVGRVFNEDYKLDFGAPGYNNPDPCANGCSTSDYLDANGYSKFAYSAYVRDGIYKTNYVFAAVPVPEAETYAMMLAGLGMMGFMARRRKENQA